MEEKGYTEKDWRLFSSKIADWQENYMEKLNSDYVALLTGEGLASEKFWQLEKRIKEDKKNTGVVVDMRRSMLLLDILSLLSEGAITLHDLDDFSAELQGRMKFLVDRNF